MICFYEHCCFSDLQLIYSAIALIIGNQSGFGNKLLFESRFLFSKQQEQLCHSYHPDVASWKVCSKENLQILLCIESIYVFRFF